MTAWLARVPVPTVLGAPRLLRWSRRSDVQISKRGPRGVRVTAAGAALIDRARTALLAARDLGGHRAAAQRFLERHSADRRHPDGRPYPLPEVAPSLRRLLPDLHVVWSEDKTQALVEQIERAALDGAIVALDDSARPISITK